MKNTCPVCNVEYERAPSRMTKYCSLKCYRATQLKGMAKEYQKKLDKGNSRNSPLSLKQVAKMIKGAVYGKHKEKYLDKVIPYKDSPTGKAYIGINKKPLMDNKGGYGYQGVLLQDENRVLVQCSSCGKWMKKISSAHTKRCMGATTLEYKKKFGLNKSTGLVSDETSLKLTQAALKNKKTHGNLGNFNREPKIGHKATRQYENRYGTCPEQLKARLHEFVRCNRELPSQRNRGGSLYRALTRRYGSWGHALIENGMPYFKRTGTNMVYSFPDGHVYHFNINQMHDREELFKLIEAKCLIN